MWKLGDKCKQVHYINLPMFNMFEGFHSYLFILFKKNFLEENFHINILSFGFSGRKWKDLVRGQTSTLQQPAGVEKCDRAASATRGATSPRSLLLQAWPHPQSPRPASAASVLVCNPRELPSPSFQHAPSPARPPWLDPVGLGQRSCLLFSSFSLFFSQIFFLCHESFLVP